MKLCDTSTLADIDGGGVDRKVTPPDETGRYAITIVAVTELRLGVDFQYERWTDRYQ
jgi:tRNA(fMet)-specific endonuclease VapC